MIATATWFCHIFSRNSDEYVSKSASCTVVYFFVTEWLYMPLLFTHLYLIHSCTDSNWEAEFPWAGTIQVWIIGLLSPHSGWRWQKGSVTYISVVSTIRKLLVYFGNSLLWWQFCFFCFLMNDFMNWKYILNVLSDNAIIVCKILMNLFRLITNFWLLCFVTILKRII